MKLPWMRLEYESAMAELASLEIQKQIWPNPPPFCGFDLVVHIIFDDVNIVESEGLGKEIGLSDEQEKAAREVMARIEALWSAWGTEIDQSVLRDQPEWTGIVDAAQRYISSSKSPEGFKEHSQSAKEYGKPFKHGNPFLDETDAEYVKYLEECKLRSKSGQ